MVAVRTRSAAWSPLALLAALMLAAASGVRAQVEPPGGIPRDDTPQFILVTHDDAVTSTAVEAVTTMLGSLQSADGCRAAATFFTQSQGTDCALLKQMYDAGHEIADHTVSHQEMFTWDAQRVEEEVVGARSYLATQCGIPEGDIVGFRAPFLQTSAVTRQVLAGAGFQYDSSVIETSSGQSVTRDAASRLWPFSLADGFPSGMVCSWTPTQSCDPSSERYPGVWEVPVWALALGDKAFSMDYGKEGTTEADTYDLLKANFDATYAGNRAPLPIFIHSITPWYSEGPQRAQAVARFLEYALAQPNVYAVTMRQLLAWMQNPVPASQLSPAALGCGNPGGAPGSGDVPSPNPTPASPGLEPPSPSDWPVEPPSPAADDMCSYTLQEDDTLSAIAEAAGLSLDDLLALNPQITNPDEVLAGDVIALC